MLSERKQALRRQVRATRNAQPDKDFLSRLICETCMALPQYQLARTIMWYLDTRSEVRTRPSLAQALTREKRIIVPYCQGSELGLYSLKTIEECAPGAWQIPEPAMHLREDLDKRVMPQELDFILVPGVAFDRTGGRLGNGYGYYDRLLAQVRSDTLLVGISFESQVLEALPLAPHDIRMDRVITEAAIYFGQGRQPPA